MEAPPPVVALPLASFGRSAPASSSSASSQQQHASSSFDFAHLAQTLLQIGGGASSGGERERRTRGAALPSSSHHKKVVVASSSAAAHNPAPAFAQQQPLPSGMQMLCAVAWDAVYSPMPPPRHGSKGAAAAASEEKYPFASPQTPRSTRKLQAPLSPSSGASSLRPGRAGDVLPSPPNRFSTQLVSDSDSDEDADAWPSPRRALRAHSRSDEEDESHHEQRDVLNEQPERMHAYLSPMHPALVNLTRATQQLQGVEWGDDARSTTARASPSITRSTPHSTSAFHDTSTFSTASQYQPTPTRAPRRAAFHVQQPADFALDQPDSDDDMMVETPQEHSFVSQAAVAAPRNLALEYEHLQQALHTLQRDYSEQLAADVRLKIQELDVALALAVGIEPQDDALDASIAESPLVQHSRAHATQHNVSALSARLSSAHATRLAAMQDQFLALQQSHSTMYATLRTKLAANETKIAAVLAHNHQAVTRMRDDALKVQQEKQRAAQEAAEAEKKRVEAEKAAAVEAAKAKAEADKEAQEATAAAEAAAKVAADASAKAAADKVAAAAGVARAAAAASVSAPPGGAVVAAASSAAVQEMALRTANLAQCRTAYVPFSTNPAHKQRKMQLLMHINRQVAQVVGTVSQVRSKAEQLLILLRQSKASSQEEYAFCLDMIATKFVSFTKSKVRLQNSAAFPLAMVALYVSLEHAPFTDVLLASLAEKCIYVVPQYLSRNSFPSMSAYMLALGYEEQAPDPARVQVEGQPGPPPAFDGEEQYFERMVGYVCMYAAFCEKDAAAHPHDISHAWTWLTRVLEQKPRSATASILHAMLSIAGHSLQAKYPDQMLKLLTFINTDYILRLDATTPPRKAAQAVLALWLQTAMHQLQQYGRLQEPEGKNMPVSQDSDASQQEVHHDDV